MTHPGSIVKVSINAEHTHQPIDGFGVNINARYFDQRLLPAMDLLVNDLGASLYRVDIWGKSNWIDPEGTLGPASLDKANQSSIYGGEVFQRGWAMMRWFNQHGIQPYLTASGIVPPWMLAGDGKTLADFDAFTTMLVDMIEWAKTRESLDFGLFGPLNETDLGPPEGPLVSPENYVRVCEMLVEKLSARGFDEIKLVVAEQAHFDPGYLAALTGSRSLRGKIGAFGMHTYADLPVDQYRQVTDIVNASEYAGTPVWMSEYGDLEQTGEREWWVAWKMTERLFNFIEAGFRGGMVWDAFDNYHDHDEHWTIYGLLRTGLRAYTPKKRYYASKQVFRFVRPGFVRIVTSADTPNLRALSFTSQARDALTIIGVNKANHPMRINAQVQGLADSLPALYCSRTTETENCHITGRVPWKGGNWPFTGIDVEVPPASIFTLSTVNPLENNVTF